PRRSRAFNVGRRILAGRRWRGGAAFAWVLAVPVVALPGCGGHARLAGGGGGGGGGSTLNAVYPARRALGLPPIPRGPVPGYVLIADRNNDRLVLVAPGKRVVWNFPHRSDLRRGPTSRDPNHAFFPTGFRHVRPNEEFHDQIA